MLAQCAMPWGNGEGIREDDVNLCILQEPVNLHLVHVKRGRFHVVLSPMIAGGRAKKLLKEKNTQID